ncbi:MAG: patatin-like phospholipase family protein [Bacteroidales bacterium]|nr:patatin-like phospholipase family protein [Bacteroidales bacterium]
MCILTVAWSFADDSIRRPRVGLVLSGGGAKGMAHVGALKVLEEVGMPIDYIGGTSMGSIVGGLYAIGYTTSQLETYIKGENWNYLLTDKVFRENIVVYEKGERKKYWLQFPFTLRKFSLPKGILTGQNVSNLFTELTSPVFNQPDFSQFPIPFLCVATDLKNGCEVVLEHGDLPQAMRASMAIPSVFMPVDIDGRTLFDGGLVNNFPANLVKEKGMDILIGIDVTAQQEHVELNNVYRIAEQVVFMASFPLKEENKKLCRILIHPDISEYHSASFNAVDSLIERGERAARQHYGALKMLADSLNSLQPQTVQPFDCPQPLPSFHIKKIYTAGLVNTTKQFVLQRMGIKENSNLDFPTLNKAVERIKGTLIFESIVYDIRLSPDDSLSVDLFLTFSEYNTRFFRIGLHYDKEYQSALLLNVSFRNVLLNNSKAQANLFIGKYPAISLSYHQNPGLRFMGNNRFLSSLLPEWYFQFDAFQRSYTEYQGREETGIFDCMDIVPALRIQNTPTINSVVGVGMIGDYTHIRSRFPTGRNARHTSYTFMTYQFYYELDTYNEDYFPTAGNFLRLQVDYHKGLSKNVRETNLLFNAILRSNFAASPVSRWTIHSGIHAGMVFGDPAPPQFNIYAGGLPDRLHRYEFRFMGVNFMQQSARNLVAVHFNNQIRLWNNIFVTLRADFGKMDDHFINLLTPSDFMLGYGISLQYNSVVGPLGFTFGSSNVTESLLAAVHFGFWF